MRNRGTIKLRMTDGSTIDYEALAQDAMRGLVRTVLQLAAKSGLPGDHHFYISFDTQAAGVTLSKRLREKYPAEMTVVLQHRFWDLAVSDDRFEVKLTFDGIPERLVIPFASLKVFFDPSVRYGLQFEDPDLGPDAQSIASNGFDAETRTATRSVAPRKPRAAKKPRPERELADAPAASSSGASAPTPIGAKTAGPGPVSVSSGNVGAGQSGAGKTVELRPANPGNGASGGAQVVSLSDFRKK